MGWLSWLTGGGLGEVGGVVERVGGVFRPNAEKEAVRRSDSYKSAQTTYSKEYRGTGVFNQLLDAINRLPRPALALGTIALFVYAFRDPVGFAEVMVSLDLVPTELWWMLSTITVFYFGGRELHKYRQTKPVEEVVKNIQIVRRLRDHLTPDAASDDSPDVVLDISNEKTASDNAAVVDWKSEL